MIVFVEQIFDDSYEDNIITILARFYEIMMIGVLHEPIQVYPL